MFFDREISIDFSCYSLNADAQNISMFLYTNKVHRRLREI